MKSRFVSLHPYFKAHPGKVDQIKASLARFIKRTATEKQVIFYEFTVKGDEFFCREAYENADGLLAHLNNVGDLLAEVFEISDITRLEVHGPAEELEKLKKPMTHLNPAFFELV